MKKIFFIVLTTLEVFSLPNKILPQYKDKITVGKNSIDIALENRLHNFSDEQKNHFTIRDYYEFTDESSSGYFKLPSRELIIAIPRETEVQVSIISSSAKEYKNIIPALNPAIVMVNDSTITLEEIEYSNRKPTDENKPVVENKGYFWFRDFYCVHLKINTHIYSERSNSIVELSDIVLKVELDKNSNILNYSPIETKSSFDDNLKLLIVNSEIAEQFRDTPKIVTTDTSGNWINYSANYLKIGAGSDTLYRITKNFLIANGINISGINPKTFQLFESGVEKPIYVSGESDESFDDNDYIEYYGTKNYSKISPRVINPNNLPYNNYLDKYTDTTIYFLTWGVNNGLRAAEVNVFQPSVSDTLTHFTSFTHLEENPMDALFYTFHNDLVESQFPFWDTGKGWYWRFLATWSGPGNYTFPMTDIVPNKTARFLAKLTSRGSTGSINVHLLKLLLNNSLIDSQIASRYQRILLDKTISSNSLLTGNNNLVITYAENAGASNGQLVIDWIEAEYPKKLKLSSNSLYFEYRDLASTALRLFKIENVLDTNYLLYKVKPELKRIIGFNLIGTDLVFTDTVSNGDAYYLIHKDSYSEPKFFAYKSFLNLRSQNSQVDYIGITHPVFHSSVSDYLNFISANYSVTTNLFSVNDIYDEFGFGYPTPESIREFLMIKFQNSPSPKPLYLVFFGDANYDYKKYRTISQGIIGGGNYVPSYGFPVSDQYYTIWNSTGLRLPQMYVGRIPLNNNSEMAFYKSKVQNNILQPYDEWNKKYLFFSGGRANYPDEIALYKSVNDSVINNFIISPPLCGIYKHFYKTSNPISDFGPYPDSEIKEAIAGGGVFMSYIGHSGTATWDNSISDVRQLKNSVNRNSVLTDFGCSTNKFAEPDIVSFGERFILDLDGQALGYIGNSALGFVSTAIKGPGNFYKHVIRDTMFQVGKAHWYAKKLMFDQLGNSNVAAQFSIANTLMGDPIVEMKIPNLPNLTIKPSDIAFGSNFINDAMDSIEVILSLNNYGTVIPQSFKLLFSHSYKGGGVEQIEKTLALPKFRDTISYWVKVKEKPGQHTISINLDSENSISEIYENDNDLNFHFDVASTFIRDILVSRIENPLLDSLIILNPSIKSSEPMLLNFQISDNENFNNPMQTNFNLDTFYTKISFSNPSSNNRYWLRYKLSDGAEWSNSLSYSKLSGSKYFVEDDHSWHFQSLKDLSIKNDAVEIKTDTVTISVVSAGGYSGQYCIITKNGINILSNTFFQGIGVVIFDEKTLAVDSSAWFELFNNLPGINACVQFINSIPEHKLVALGVSGDAKNNPSPELNAAIVALGGTRFPELEFKAPYVLFGKRGADSTQVKQVIKNPNEGPILLDSNLVLPLNSGFLTSTQIGPSSEWKKLKVSQTNQNDSQIKYKPIIIKSDGNDTTLAYLDVINSEADLSFISAVTYPYLKIISELNADSLLNSPKLMRLEVDYQGIAELGTNYQAVKLNKDTLEQGEIGRISFYVYNVGESKADDFKVEVGVIRPDNSYQSIFNSIINLAPYQRQFISADYLTTFESGNRTYKISIDPDNRIREYFEDNNVYLTPFFIKPDTTMPVLNVQFNGKEIMDGDYIVQNPTIRMELSDPSILPIVDTTSIALQLDNVPIYFAQNPNILSYEFNPTNPKMIVEYKPLLEEGEHILKVFANDGFGNASDSLGFQKRFVVSNETNILDIYNYPNPVKENTYFTFRLTQVPDEIKIMVYTIAGRLVKEIVKTRSELSTDFNKIFWDCRDEDGDLLGNGTYLYKVLMKASDKTETSVNKLAIVR